MKKPLPFSLERLDGVELMYPKSEMDKYIEQLEAQIKTLTGDANIARLERDAKLCSECPRTRHFPAAFINNIAEEGTKEEAVKWLQKIWSQYMTLREDTKMQEHLLVEELKTIKH